LRYLLDTNILIYLIKNRPASIAEQINRLPAEAELGMSFITYAELLKGVARSNRPLESEQNLTRLTRQIPVWYQTNQALCRHYAVQLLGFPG
jgi:tRNA(fMet)-specific endonuclease VapC